MLVRVNPQVDIFKKRIFFKRVHLDKLTKNSTKMKKNNQDY